MSKEMTLWDRIIWWAINALMWLAKWNYIEIKRNAHKNAGEVAGFRRNEE